MRPTDIFLNYSNHTIYFFTVNNIYIHTGCNRNTGTKLNHAYKNKNKTFYKKDKNPIIMLFSS